MMLRDVPELLAAFQAGRDSGGIGDCPGPDIEATRAAYDAGVAAYNRGSAPIGGKVWTDLGRVQAALSARAVEKWLAGPGARP